jgi:hypothetical protein
VPAARSFGYTSSNRREDSDAGERLEQYPVAGMRRKPQKASVSGTSCQTIILARREKLRGAGQSPGRKVDREVGAASSLFSSVVSGICFVPQVIYWLSSSRSFFATGFAITDTAPLAG